MLVVIADDNGELASEIGAHCQELLRIESRVEAIRFYVVVVVVGRAVCVLRLSNSGATYI
jgi:hypothetical protein